jgi:hypothetical protein
LTEWQDFPAVDNLPRENRMIAGRVKFYGKRFMAIAGTAIHYGRI